MTCSSAPPLSVIVPTRDRPEHLRRCLVALRGELRPGDELIVSDSASTDPAVTAIAVDLGARVVRCERAGASLARNRGAAAATRQLLAFVDDDVTVGPGWAAAMAAALSKDGVAFVCGRVALPPDQPGDLRQVAVKDDPEPAVLGPDTPAPLGCSANLGVRAEDLRAVGGFDEGLGGGARYHAAEDLDLFDRLLAAGRYGWYEPGVLAWHDQWRSRRQLLRLDWRYGIGMGARLAKLLRTDRRRARRAACECVWTDGLTVVGRAVADRHEFLALTTVLRLLGTGVGVAVALVAPVDRGCYVPPIDGPAAPGCHP